MKKTISINISGILFHIEEDAYSQLKRYLENIQRHFSSYPDGSTVIQDIETRIAEIFLSKLKNNKQVLTAEDVGLLIEKMGKIADFQAVERLNEKEDFGFGTEKEQGKPENAEDPFATGQKEGAGSSDYRYVTPDPSAQKGYKKLSRLHHGKVIAGVCAGIAHYVKMDPLWVRLIAILLLFSGRITFLNLDSLQGWGWPNLNVYFGNFGLLAYIILWVLLPVSYELPEDKTIKKLYRNPDDKVIGGVAGGLAAYFQLDVMIVRVGFFLLAFVGGTGVVLYLILWIITPSAASITDRIRMKGEAVTLTKIDDTLKQNLGAQPAQQQAGSPLLQPFRWLGKALQALGQALGPLGLVLILLLRIFLGLVLMLVGIALIFASFALVISYFGLQGPWSEGVLYDWPIREINDVLNPYLAISLMLAVFVPGLALFLAGVSVLIRKSIINGKLALILFGLWLLSVLLSGLNIGFIAKDFRQNATVEETFHYTAEAVPLFRLEGEKEQGRASGQRDRVQVSLLAKPEKTTPEVLLTKRSSGPDRERARQAAKAIPYSLMLADSVWAFPTHFEQQNPLRQERLQLEVQLPHEFPFRMDRSMSRVLRQTLYANGYRLRDLQAERVWVFNPEGLLCLNCPESHKNSPADSLSRQRHEKAYFMR